MLLGAVPGCVLVLLMAAGELAVLPGLLGLAAVAAGSYALARLWVRDLARILWALHRAEPDGGGAPDPGPPLLSATARITQAADRLAAALAGREAEMRALLAAERDLVHRLPDPLVVLDGARQVQRTNAAAEAGFGTQLGSVLRHPGLRGALDRAQATGADQSAALSLGAPILRELEATVIPLLPPPGERGRFVVVLSDRTRERAVERMRADFVANASHELRTPLTGVIGFIDTLLGPAADDKPAQERFLRIMAEQAQRMNRLIDDLLSLSRIELTEHQIPRERVEAGLLLRRAVAAFEPRLKARGMELDLVLPDGGAAVWGDEDQLDQVMQNLLDNAVKYGRAGGTVRVGAVGAAGGRWPARPGLAIAVVDDGAGVAPEHLPRLTERFYRADKHRSRAVGGTGLGLAIVKHIVNRHQGRLLIESAAGRGTTVTVWLPAAAPEDSGAGGRA